MNKDKTIVTFVFVDIIIRNLYTNSLSCYEIGVK